MNTGLLIFLVVLACGLVFFGLRWLKNRRKATLKRYKFTWQDKIAALESGELNEDDKQKLYDSFKDEQIAIKHSPLLVKLLVLLEGHLNIKKSVIPPEILQSAEGQLDEKLR